MPIAAVERADQLVEGSLKLQLLAAVLGHFQGQLGSVTRSAAALSKLVRVCGTRCLRTREGTLGRIAPGLLGVLAAIVHGAANCEYRTAQQGQNDDRCAKSACESQWMPSLLVLSAARLSRR